MNQLIIDNHVIKQDIKEILSTLKSELSNGKLSNIQYKGDEVSITCPFHKEGKENKPSCFIYVGEDGKIPWGTFHCFTCGEKGSLVKFISGVLDCTESYAQKWLKDNFTENIIEENAIDIDSPIMLNNFINNSGNNRSYLNEDILNNFQSWHPYIGQRHISKEIAERFQIKYDPATQTVVFPVRDVKNNLIFLTRRSIEGKKFYIDESASKTVYLLNEAVKNKYNQVIVVESQINALVSYSYGFPAVALFGAGTTKGQIDELNKTTILHYILMYDNDEAGRRGANKFKKLIKNNAFITDIIMPKNKDVADCSKEEFLDILRNNDVLLD